uniref:Si:ch211-262h13.5 n=1 Tax=Tetraodon nigroviridis TaxID=99883 RepID=H3DL46_TETNG
LFYSYGVCVRSKELSLTPIELAPVPCNDKAVGKLSRLAMTYINEDRPDGYKFALNRVANVHLHAQGARALQETSYYLDLDVLETKHLGSSRPWKRCEIRPFMETQISGNCNTTLLYTPEGYTYLYSYDCTLVPDPPEKLQQTCPTCPLLLPVESHQAVNTARITLASYRRQFVRGADLGVKTITRASTKAVPEKSSFVEYTVQECPEGLTERGTCQQPTPDSDTQAAGFCVGSVHGNMKLNPEVLVSCEMFKDAATPTFPSTILDSGNDPLQPVVTDPAGPPAVQPPPPAPTPIQPAPIDPSVVVHPSTSRSSSSSESAEGLSDSSSEEIGGPVALRPPVNFRYLRRERRKRQAHSPIFLSEFPSGFSPFRSCPGPSRYTTV